MKTKEEKIQWLADNYLANNSGAITILEKYWNRDESLQKLHDGFIENTISNYYLPFSIAPNFLINQKLYVLPMVIEESSVVAAASNAAKFWLDKGGFIAKVISTIKNGQIHINFFGSVTDIQDFFSEIKPQLQKSITSIEKNMKKRGGGLLDISLINTTEKLDGYYQLHCTFNTGDAMGANFINSCLEKIANTFETLAKEFSAFADKNTFPEVILSILSNYVPECLVQAHVQCSVEQLTTRELKGEKFAEKFVRAVDIAIAEPRRAVTHNKGIMNGIDAVLLATGNDYRAVESGIHAYASKNGNYTSLTHAKIENGIFSFWIDGWAKIVNEHPQSDGSEFVYERKNDALIAITCKMYRKDRTHPIEVTEFLSECSRDTAPWQQWPYRMLRHKAFIQAARLAFGLSGIVDPDEAERIQSVEDAEVEIVSPADQYEAKQIVEGESNGEKETLTPKAKMVQEIKHLLDSPALSTELFDEVTAEMEAGSYTVKYLTDTLERLNDHLDKALAGA